MTGIDCEGSQHSIPVEEKPLQVLVFTLAAVLALNIGGSGAGAAMAASYASGVLPRARALAVFAACALAGALLGGHRVVVTLSSSLVPASVFTYSTVVAVSAAAALALVLANTARVPQSTTHVLVAAIAGVGLANGALKTAVLARILLAWCINPLLALVLCYSIGRWLLPRIEHRLGMMGAAGERIQRAIVIAAACYMAVGIGANNVGNAVSTLVGGRLLEVREALVFGGGLMALGGLTIGRRLVSTTGREIASLSLLKGALVGTVTASLILAASRLGLPTSYVQTSTLAVVGVGASSVPLAELLGQQVIRRIGLTWLASPTLAFLAGFWLEGRVW